MKLQELNEQSFKEFIKEGKVLIKAWREGCSNCDAIIPILEKISDAIPSVKFANFELKSVSGESSDFKREYMKFPAGQKVMLPVLFYFEDGILVRKIDGLFNEEAIVKFILDEALPTKPDARKEKMIGLFSQKGEIITNMEILQNHLNNINKEINELLSLNKYL